MSDPIKIESRGDLQAFLNDQPKDVAFTIALRSALRATPLIADQRISSDGFRLLTLVAFRATLISQFWHSAADAASDASVAVDKAVNAVALTGSSSSASAASACYAAAYAASNDTNGYHASAAVDFAADAASYASASDFAASRASDFWDQTRYDCIGFKDGDLRATPLWKNHKAPGWWLTAEALFSKRLNTLSEDWGSVYQWYSNAARNTTTDPFPIKALNDIANESSEFWGNGDDNPRTPDDVIADIAGRLGWPANQTPRNGSAIDAQNIIDLSQYKAALYFREQEEFLIMEPPVLGDDEKEAENPTTQKLHENLRKLLPKMEDDIRAAAQWPGRGDMADAYDDLVEATSGTTKDLATNIVDYWTSLCRLGSFLEEDDDVALGRIGSKELEPTVRRKLQTMVRIAGPLARRFPTSRELDDESAHYQNPEKRYGAAAEAISTSAQFRLLTPDDIQTLKDFVSAIERGDVQSGKLKGLLTKTGSNLVTKSLNVIGAFLLGATASVAGPELQIVQKAADVIIASESAVIEFLEDVPPASRQSALAIINDLKKQGDENDPMPERLLALRERYEDEHDD